MIADIFHEIQKAGLTISILNSSSLAVEPKDKITDELRLMIREHKPELIELLKVTPKDCQKCQQLEMISIDGNPLAGCVKKLEVGRWREEWHRLPADLQGCIIFH